MSNELLEGNERGSYVVLERLHPAYKVLNLPFTFRDRAHWLKVTSNEIGSDVLGSTTSKGLTGLTFYDAGARHLVLDLVGPYEERPQQIEAFARDVLPLLADLRR